jgi:hypothetical protein
MRSQNKAFATAYAAGYLKALEDHNLTIDVWTEVDINGESVDIHIDDNNDTNDITAFAYDVDVVDGEHKTNTAKETFLFRILK